MQGLVDLDRHMPWRQILRQFLFAAEHVQAFVAVVIALGFGLHRRRRVRRQRRDDFGQRLEFGAAIGFIGGGKAIGPDRLIAGQQFVLAEQAGFQRDRCRTQQGVASLDPHQLFDAAPLDLEVGAGMTHDACGAQMQEGRPTRTPAVFDGALDIGIAAGEIESVGLEIIEIAALAEIALDPASGRLH